MVTNATDSTKLRHIWSLHTFRAYVAGSIGAIVGTVAVIKHTPHPGRFPSVDGVHLMILVACLCLWYARHFELHVRRGEMQSVQAAVVANPGFTLPKSVFTNLKRANIVFTYSIIILLPLIEFNIVTIGYDILLGALFALLYIESSTTLLFYPARSDSAEKAVGGANAHNVEQSE